VCLIGLFVLFVLLGAAPVQAAPRLDPAFGVVGVAALHRLDPAGIVATPAGIVVAGEFDGVGELDGVGFARFTQDGQEDPAFGIDGIVTVIHPLAAQEGFGYQVGGPFVGADGRLTGHQSYSAPCLASVDAAGEPGSVRSGDDCGHVNVAQVFPRSGGGRLEVTAYGITAFNANGSVDRSWSDDGLWHVGGGGIVSAASAAADDELLVATSRGHHVHRGNRWTTRLRRLDAMGRETAALVLPAAGFDVQQVDAVTQLTDGTVLVTRARRDQLLVGRIDLSPGQTSVVATARRRLPHPVGEIAVVAARRGATLLAAVDDPRHSYHGAPAGRITLLAVTDRTRIGSPHPIGPVVEDDAEIVGATRQDDGRVVAAIAAGYDGGHVLLGIKDD
jgi:hypothetical protein